MSMWLQWAIIAFIVVAIAFVAWRSGGANPETTGQLGRKFNKVSGEVAVLSARFTAIEAEIEEMKREGATVKDIERIEERISTVRAEIAGHKEVSMRTNHSVDRIERLLIEKGLGK